MTRFCCVFPTILPVAKAKTNLIEVTINGEQQRVASSMTIADLLVELDLNSRAIAVEINQEIQPRNTHRQTTIQSGDVLEIVTLVGGG